MHKASVKALPLPLDLAALSSSGDGSDEYHHSHQWIYVVYLLVRRTGTKHY
jgi:hypothetical protein